MSMEICIQLPDGQMHCHPIPVLIRKFPPDLPEPDPRWLAAALELLKPRPDPWVIDERIAPEVVQDLEVLAGIESLLSQASPQLRATLQRTVQNSLAEQPLPRGVTVEFEQIG